MPPHWFIPVRASDAKGRKRDVQGKLGNHRPASLHSFWRTPDGTQLYAIVKANALNDALLRDIGANGEPISLEDV